MNGKTVLECIDTRVKFININEPNKDITLNMLFWVRDFNIKKQGSTFLAIRTKTW